MAQYFTDFSEYAVNAQPHDWVDRWSTSGNWTVRDDNGKQVLRCQGSGRDILTWSLVGEIANGEILFCQRRSSSSGPGAAALFRGSGTSGNETGHVFWPVHDASGGTLRISAFVSGSFRTPLNDSGHAVIADIWYWSRVRVIEGVAHSVSRWTGGIEDESSAIVFDNPGYADSPSGPGWVGLYHNGNFTDIDLFAVGTDGDPAPSEPVDPDPPTRRHSPFASPVFQSPVFGGGVMR